LGQAELTGRGQTFASLYRRHFGFVWSLTAHFGVPPAAREDVAQDVWLAIHRRIDALRPEASSRAWVASIARNVALHLHRAQGRRLRKHAALTVVADMTLPPPSTDAIATLEVVLQRMEPAQREVFLLIAVEELSGPEVAAALGIPLNTVYSRLRLARARLAAAVSEIEERDAVTALRVEPPSRGAANRMWFALAMDLGWRTATPMTLASTWTAKLAVVAVSAMTTVVGTAALGGHGDRSAHAHPSIAVGSAAPGVPASARASSAPTPASVAAPVLPELPEPPVIATMAAAISPVPATVHRRATPTVRSVPRLKPRAPTPAEPVAESASAATLAAESALLGQAQRALSARDPARARSLLEQHADQFPHGDLALDRRAAWARMLCVAGEAEAARELAASLGREHPRVPAVVALRDVCRAP
jgi:RNA polymerase sigma factor (sigma-70 family)